MDSSSSTYKKCCRVFFLNEKKMILVDKFNKKIH